MAALSQVFTGNFILKGNQRKATLPTCVVRDNASNDSVRACHQSKTVKGRSATPSARDEIETSLESSQIHD